MKKNTYVYALAILLLICNMVAAQQTRKEEIATKLSDYFFLERENIHVHFNKNVFFTDEQIWFKGYVFHRKKNVPFFSSTNIYASLLDSEGKILDTHLIAGNIGSFTGNIKLDSNYASGKYYLQFYTNWMNNFTEDESSVYEIKVINEKDSNNISLINNADFSNLTIDFHPEGGTLLQGTNNSIGIKISGCNHTPLPVSTIDIADSKGNILKKVQINKMGYGKFELLYDSKTSYKAIINHNGNIYEKPLPTGIAQGITLEINNYALSGKTIAKIRTNEATLNSLKNKPLYFLVHKDNAAVIYEFMFDGTTTEQVLALANNELFEGTNTIRIINNEMEQLAERIIYNYPESALNTNLKKGNTSDRLTELKGKVNYPNMNLSISLLPENTISIDETNDIYGSFLILPYIEGQEKVSGRYYLTTLSKGRHYEMDLFLLNQKSKYEWKNIVNSPPKSNFVFDMGLTLKGSVTKKTGNYKLFNVRLNSPKYGIDETTKLDENYEFYFENLIIPDSAEVSFTLLQKGAEPKNIYVFPQITNNGRRYYKMYHPKKQKCPENYSIGTAIGSKIEAPLFFKESTLLEEVKIEGNTLKYAKQHGNSNARGYKISDTDKNGYTTLINFLKFHSRFEINDNGSEITIYKRGIFSINAAQPKPIIYLDNVQITDYTILRTINLDEIDEIYIDENAIVPSLRNFMGMIRIYPKKGIVLGKKRNTIQYGIVKNAFKQVEYFKPDSYLLTSGKGFENFGIINWYPAVMTDENGNFILDVPNTSQKNIKVLIEGFSADGKLISEIKNISLE